MSSTTLYIKNNGPLISATNYWEVPPAPGEFCYLSLNAGAFRLLLRREAERSIADMRAARECLVSRGPWPRMGLSDAIEVLFEDGTEAPFVLHLDLHRVDRLPLDSDAETEWVLSAWTRSRAGPHLALKRPCWYRRVSRLPWMRPRTEGNP